MLTQLVLVLLLLVVVIVAAFFFLYPRRKRGELSRASHESRDVANGPVSQKRGLETHDVTLRSLAPGDAVIFWDGTDNLVETVLSCEEHVGDRTTRWDWVFLSDGKVLESSPHQVVLYAQSRVLYQGSKPFAELTADVSQLGILKTFEARVRAGTIGNNPVIFDFEGQSFRVRSTGTFLATSTGKALDAEVWCDISEKEGDNVFFKLQQAEGDQQALGIWTTHIVLLIGKPMAESDARGLYSARERGKR